MSIAIGDQAPDFTLPTDGNGSLTLSQLRAGTGARSYNRIPLGRPYDGRKLQLHN